MRCDPCCGLSEESFCGWKTAANAATEDSDRDYKHGDGRHRRRRQRGETGERHRQKCDAATAADAREYASIRERTEQRGTNGHSSVKCCGNGATPPPRETKVVRDAFLKERDKREPEASAERNHCSAADPSKKPRQCVGRHMISSWQIDFQCTREQLLKLLDRMTGKRSH